MHGQDETAADDRPIEELVLEARSGSSAALEEVVALIQGPVHALALRMLFHPADAEDASQEILIKVITNLHAFRFEGPFRAWVMRIAANHLKSARKLASEQRGLDFDRAVARLDRAQSRGWFSHPLAAPQPLMEAEMRATCAQALLLCLDRGHRLAFILGVVMGLSGQDGAYILDITPQTFRKRLSRARERVANFLEHNCGLFDPDNRCHCGALAAGYLQKGWLDPGRPLFTAPEPGGQTNETLSHYLRELDDLQRVSTFYQASPQSERQPDFTGWVKSLLGAGKYSILDHEKPGDSGDKTRH